MHETPEDLRALQRVLDEGAAAAGPHLARVVTPEHRVDAVDLCRRLQGMCLLALATVTADGRPRVSPVDGIFYRGEFWFGTAPDALRMRHLRRRPDVSATHIPGEEFAVTVHGRAVPADLRDPAHAGFRRTLLGIYLPRYGDDWEQIPDGDAVYLRIVPECMYAFALTPQPSGA
jgi:hypothetical protein